MKRWIDRIKKSLVVFGLLTLASAAWAQPEVTSEMLDEMRPMIESALDGDLPEGASDDDMAGFQELVQAIKRGEDPSSDEYPSQVIDLIRTILMERGALKTQDAPSPSTDAGTPIKAARGPGTGAAQADRPQPAAPSGPAEGTIESDEQRMVSMSFRNMEMEKIGQFLLKELKRPVIVHDEIRNVRITIIAQDKLPLTEALDVLGEALRQKGVFVLESPRQIQLLPLSQIRNVSRRVVGPEQAVSELTMQSAIVDKVFEIEHYDIEKIKDVIQPLLPEYALVLADPNTRRVIVTDAAANLARIERVIEGLDVESANQAVQKIFEIEHGDASEIVNMVRIIIAGTLGGEARDVFSSTGNASRGRSSGPSRSSRGGSQPSNVVFVEPNNGPILLYADLTRNWVIAAAAPSVMEKIEKWVKDLDQQAEEEADEPFVLVEIKHAEIDEVSDQIEDAIGSIPDDDIRNNTRVIPFKKSRQLLVYGSPRGRAMVKSMLEQLDVEASRYEAIKEIKIEHDTAANIKAKIDDLFGKEDDNRPRFFFSSRRGDSDSDSVKVTADNHRNTITIVCPPNKLEQIEKLIKDEWDVKVDIQDVKPKIYSLQYVDPEQVQELLESMYTRSTQTSFAWWVDDDDSESENPVGRLHGQFSFEALEGTTKLIVSSTSAENYSVIDEIIEELDQPLDAGLPFVMELKHANCEDMAEQLNAIFSETGSPAAVRRTARGLSRGIRGTGRGDDGNNNNNGNNNQNTINGNNNQPDDQTMEFWWSQSRARADEQPISALVGKPRIVPVTRRNALMVLAPQAYIEPMKEMIEDLDKPGSQVVINAVIAEVIHDDETSLGVRFASDPSLLADSNLADQSIGGSVNLAYEESFGSGRGTLDVGLDLNLLIQLLKRKVNLKILNEPRVFTADNQEAHFFDGQDVPVITSDQDTSSDNLRRSFAYEEVGTRLHVRPHITQNGDIDLEVNIELSRVDTSETVFGNFIFTRRETTTQVTLKDGQTVVISGIIRTEDFEDVRKLPFFGDLPLVGGLFRNNSRAARNIEVVAFITPTIINHAGQEADTISQENEDWLEALRSARSEDVEVQAEQRKKQDAETMETLKPTPDGGAAHVPDEPVEPAGEDDEAIQ